MHHTVNVSRYSHISVGRITISICCNTPSPSSSDFGVAYPSAISHHPTFFGTRANIGFCAILRRIRMVRKHMKDGSSQLSAKQTRFTLALRYAHHTYILYISLARAKTSISLHIYLEKTSLFISIYLSIYLPSYLSIYISIYLSISIYISLSFFPLQNCGTSLPPEAST